MQKYLGPKKNPTSKTTIVALDVGYMIMIEIRLINKSNRYQIDYSFLKDIERRKNVTELFIGLT